MESTKTKEIIINVPSTDFRGSIDELVAAATLADVRQRLVEEFGPENLPETFCFETIPADKKGIMIAQAQEAKKRAWKYRELTLVDRSTARHKKARIEMDRDNDHEASRNGNSTKKPSFLKDPPLSSIPLPTNNKNDGSGIQNERDGKKIRHRQQRILLLRHASRCQCSDSKCPFTAHCTTTKKLLKHMRQCQNEMCTVQHCVSSRYILGHYRSCKDRQCPVCVPVRASIRLIACPRQGTTTEKTKNSNSDMHMDEKRNNDSIIQYETNQEHAPGTEANLTLAAREQRMEKKLHENKENDSFVDQCFPEFSEGLA